jgi:hypothetical protein
MNRLGKRIKNCFLCNKNHDWHLGVGKAVPYTKADQSLSCEDNEADVTTRTLLWLTEQSQLNWSEIITTGSIFSHPCVYLWHCQPGRGNKTLPFASERFVHILRPAKRVSGWQDDTGPTGAWSRPPTVMINDACVPSVIQEHDVHWLSVSVAAQTMHSCFNKQPK